MGKKLNKFQRRFIKSNYQNLSVEQIAQELKIDPKLVRQSIRDSGLQNKQEVPDVQKDSGFLNQHAGKIVLILVSAYIAFFSFISILRYNTFNFHDQDLSIHAQTVWNILHGSTHSSILGFSFLGNHLNLILFPIAPIYAIFPSALTLLLLQTLFIGLGAVPLYLIAREVLEKKFAIFFSLLYLIFPALHFCNYYEFHPVTFVPFFFMFMFYYFQKEKFAPFVCFMLLVLLCKENMSLGIIFFGSYVLFFTRRSLRWKITPIALAVAWLICALKIMPYFSKETIDFSLIYRHIGPTMPQAVANIIMHPVHTLKLMFTAKNMAFLFQLFFPLGFLSLLFPKLLLFSSPFFLQQLLSARKVDHSIEYHYAAKLVPFIFISAVYGMKFLLKSKFFSRRRGLLIGIILIASVISNFSFGLLTKLPKYLAPRNTVKAIDNNKRMLLAQIPKDASVVATFEFLPHLSQRKSVYSFHTAYTKKYTLSRKDYILPENIEYALVNFDDYLTFTEFYAAEHYKNLQSFFARGKWSLVAAVDSFALLKNGEKADLGLYRMLNEPTPLSSTRLYIEDNILILGYNIENSSIKAGEPVQLTLSWQCMRDTGKDYWLAFSLVDEDGKLLHKYNHPICYRIYPTFAWKKGDSLEENIWFFVPSNIKSRQASIKMLVIDRGTAGIKGGTAKVIAVKSNTYGIFDASGWINLGKIQIESK
ncbi:DUF2079 domain-containing protein [Candidatus Omnitrophota bacterium]